MLSCLQQLKDMIKKRNQCFVNDGSLRGDYVDKKEIDCFKRRRSQLKNRGAEIVKSSVDGQIVRQQQLNDELEVDYMLYYQFLIRIKQSLYLEETLERRKAHFFDRELYSDRLLLPDSVKAASFSERNDGVNTPLPRLSYNRLEAVRYAERYWNDYNPSYRRFENNCTNFISQCLRAGGAPITGYPNRNKGWWFKDDQWSFSWSIAHSLRWYLSGAQVGLRGKEKETAQELRPGDVICYDFDGNGKWQHITIVVDKDINGMPLVNAQSTNSRMRYWSYEDSTAWTPNINYKFFEIVDQFH